MTLPCARALPGNFLSTGLGKTACELEWSLHAAEATNGKALILAPLSVGWQIAKEANRHGRLSTLGLSANRMTPKRGINICNYDRLDNLDPGAFGAVLRLTKALSLNRLAARLRRGAD